MNGMNDRPATAAVSHRRLDAGVISRYLLIATALAIAGCRAEAVATTPPPTPSPTSPPNAAPSGPPVLGLDWARAASVERPKNFEVDPSAPPYTGTHPILRISGQAMMADVVGLPGRGFVAVGYVPPAWVPASWTSPDGSAWTIHPMGTTTFTFPVSVAARGEGPLVAVGRSGPDPGSWTSHDGIAWLRRSVPVLKGSDVPERMTTVVTTDGGYLAGGSAGPELLDRHARFWISADGVDWQPVPDDPQAFANAEVRAIASSPEGFVAVGVVGSAQQPSGAVAWTSADGSTWHRIDDPAFARGIAVAIVPAPFGGFVAVGSDLDRRNAVAWTSPDGRRWTRAPDEASRQHPGGFAWMTDAVAVAGSVIGVGDVQGLQRGTATSWVTVDGAHWERARSAPVQQQGEFYAITPGGPGVIAVGSFGAPDSYVPTVWLSPGR
jgi:hypothetical protein